MRSLSTFKEVQLTGRVVVLSRSLARLAKRAHPSFCLLKKQVEFKWMKECKRAFQDLKRFLVELLVLSKLRDREPLYIYLSTIERAISSVLIKKEQKQQN